MRNAAIWLDPAHSCRTDCSRPAARSATRHQAFKLRRCRRLRLYESAAPCCTCWCTTSASDGCCCCCCCFICRANCCCCCDWYCCCCCSCCDNSCCCSDTCCCCCCSTLRKSHQFHYVSTLIPESGNARLLQYAVIVCCSMLLQCEEYVAQNSRSAWQHVTNHSSPFFHGVNCAPMMFAGPA